MSKLTIRPEQEFPQAKIAVIGVILDLFLILSSIYIFNSIVLKWLFTIFFSFSLAYHLYVLYYQVFKAPKIEKKKDERKKKLEEEKSKPSLMDSLSIETVEKDSGNTARENNMNNTVEAIEENTSNSNSTVEKSSYSSSSSPTSIPLLDSYSSIEKRDSKVKKDSEEKWA